MRVERVEVAGNGCILLDVVAVRVERANLIVDGRICSRTGLRLRREVARQFIVGIRAGFLLRVELAAVDGILARLCHFACLEVRDRRAVCTGKRYLALVRAGIVLDCAVREAVQVVRDVRDGGFTVLRLLGDGIRVRLHLRVERVEVAGNGCILLDVVAVRVERANLIVDGRICSRTGLRLRREVARQFGVGIRAGFLLRVELTARYSVLRICFHFSSTDILKHFIAAIDAIFSDARTVCDGQALIIDNGCIGCGLLRVALACRFRSRVRAAVQAFEILGQLDGQLAIRINRTISIIGGIRSNDADVPIAKIRYRCFCIAIRLAGIDITDDIQLMVQFDCGCATEIITKLHAVIERGNGMLIGRILRIVVDDAGNAVLAIFTVDTSSTSFRLDDSRGLAILTILAFRANKADGTVLAILASCARFTDRDVRQATMESIVDFTTSYQLTVAFSNFAGTDSRAPSFFISCLFWIRGCGLAIRTFQVLTDVGGIDIGFHAFQFLQLCDVDGIGVFCTGSQAVDLTSFSRGTNGYSCLLGCPSRCAACSCTSGIISNSASCSRCYGPAADGYAAFCADFCVVADGYDIGGCRFIVGGIGRTDDDVVLLVRQFVVITEDDVGLVRIYAVTADLVLRADDIVVLAVGQFILEAIDEVVLRRCSFCVGAVLTVHLIADTGDLGHIGFVNGVAAAHNHDLSTAGRNCILQSIFQLFSVPG